MTLEHLISDLLYRYECVVVPDFGAFISNYKSTVFNPKNNTFYPPNKIITFNANVLHNDALLVNCWASTLNCSYEEAVKVLKKTIEKWQHDLQVHKTLELDKIGSFSLNSQSKLVFEPVSTVNYLTNSYGLSSVIASQVDRKKAISVEGSTQTRSYLKYAAVFVLGLSTIGFGNRFYHNYKINQQLSRVQAQQKAVQNRIQSATFTISNPLPTITLKNTVESLDFHVVAGAFREPANAERKLKQLKDKGFKTAIIGKNKWDLTQVVFGSYATKNEALKALRKVRATEDHAAWLLVGKH